MEISKTKDIKINGENLKIVIILPYFNEDIGLELYKNAVKELKKNKVKSENIILIRVFGALEIPFACQKVIKKYRPDAIIALGVVVKGETTHYDLVTKISYEGTMKVQLETKIPISFGILTTNTVKQAKNRASEKGLNKGAQAAQSALIQTII